MERNINQEFEQEIALIKHNDPFKNARIAELENKRQTDIDSLDCLKKRKKNQKKEKEKTMLMYELKIFLNIKKLKL